MITLTLSAVEGEGLSWGHSLPRHISPLSLPLPLSLLLPLLLLLSFVVVALAFAVAVASR